MTTRYEAMMNKKHFLPFRMGYLTEEMTAKAENELGETEEVKRRSILELRKLIQGETNLVSQTDDEYLLQYLRARKYNVKKAYSVYQNFHIVKKNYCDLYDSVDLDLLRRIYQTKAISCLPYRDEEGCIVYMMILHKWNPDDFALSDMIIALTTAILFCVEDPATQVCGVRLFVDVGEVSLKQIRCVTPRYMALFSKALRNTLPVRFRGIHIYNESVIFKYFWSVFKFFLSEKIRNRVHFHGDSQKHLHKHIPKDILPTEYGGDYPDYHNDWFNNEIESFFQRYVTITTYGYRD